MTKQEFLSLIAGLPDDAVIGFKDSRIEWSIGGEYIRLVGMVVELQYDHTSESERENLERLKQVYLSGGSYCWQLP